MAGENGPDIQKALEAIKKDPTHEGVERAFSSLEEEIKTSAPEDRKNIYLARLEETKKALHHEIEAKKEIIKGETPHRLRQFKNHLIFEQRKEDPRYKAFNEAINAAEQKTDPKKNPIDDYPGLGKDDNQYNRTRWKLMGYLAALGTYDQVKGSKEVDVAYNVALQAFKKNGGDLEYEDLSDYMGMEKYEKRFNDKGINLEDLREKEILSPLAIGLLIGYLKLADQIQEPEKTNYFNYVFEKVQELLNTGELKYEPLIDPSVFDDPEASELSYITLWRKHFGNYQLQVLAQLKTPAEWPGGAPSQLETQTKAETKVETSNNLQIRFTTLKQFYERMKKLLGEEKPPKELEEFFAKTEIKPEDEARLNKEESSLKDFLKALSVPLNELYAKFQNKSVGLKEKLKGKVSDSDWKKLDDKINEFGTKVTGMGVSDKDTLEDTIKKFEDHLIPSRALAVEIKKLFDTFESKLKPEHDIDDDLIIPDEKESKKKAPPEKTGIEDYEPDSEESRKESLEDLDDPYFSRWGNGKETDPRFVKMGTILEWKGTSGGILRQVEGEPGKPVRQLKPKEHVTLAQEKARLVDSSVFVKVRIEGTQEIYWTTEDDLKPLELPGVQPKKTAPSETKETPPIALVIATEYRDILAKIDREVEKYGGTSFDVFFNNQTLHLRVRKIDQYRYEISWGNGEFWYRNLQELKDSLAKGIFFQQLTDLQLRTPPLYQNFKKTIGELKLDGFKASLPDEVGSSRVSMKLDWANPNAELEVQAYAYGQIRYRIKREHVGLKGDDELLGWAPNFYGLMRIIAQSRNRAENYDPDMKSAERRRFEKRTEAFHQISDPRYFYMASVHTQNVLGRAVDIGRPVSFAIFENGVVQAYLDWGGGMKSDPQKNALVKMWVDEQGVIHFWVEHGAKRSSTMKVSSMIELLARLDEVKKAPVESGKSVVPQKKEQKEKKKSTKRKRKKTITIPA